MVIRRSCADDRQAGDRPSRGRGSRLRVELQKQERPAARGKRGRALDCSPRITWPGTHTAVRIAQWRHANARVASSNRPTGPSLKRLRILVTSSNQSESPARGQFTSHHAFRTASWTRARSPPPASPTSPSRETARGRPVRERRRMRSVSSSPCSFRIVFRGRGHRRGPRARAPDRG